MEESYNFVTKFLLFMLIYPPTCNGHLFNLDVKRFNYYLLHLTNLKNNNNVYLNLPLKINFTWMYVLDQVGLKLYAVFHMLVVRIKNLLLLL